MDEKKLKPCTIYFDMSDPRIKELYNTIENNSKGNKKSSYIIGVLLEAHDKQESASACSEEMCTQIADKVTNKLEPILSKLAKAPATIEEVPKKTISTELMDSMDFGLCAF